MGSNQHFYYSDKYYSEHIKLMLDNAVNDGRISESDRKYIFQFIVEITAQNNLSERRRYNLIITLINNRKYHTEYDKCTIMDLYAAIDNIINAKTNGKNHTQNTIRNEIQILKRIFLWMSEEGYSNIPLSKLKKIKPPKTEIQHLNPENLLTEEEIKRMIEVSINSRDRALISVLYEGGFRIGEIANIKWKDINFTSANVTIHTNEKTGKHRFIPLYSSRPLLAQWKNDYPLPLDNENFVFLTFHQKKPLNYPQTITQIREIASRAGITKHVKPHMFRHSRITHLVQQGLHESIIKQMMWGDVNTLMLKTYLHLSNSDISQAVAKINGVHIPDAKEIENNKCMRPIVCRRCASINAPSMKFCGECGEPLTDDEKNIVDVLKDDIQTMAGTDQTFMYEMMPIITSMKTLAEKHNIKLSIDMNEINHKP